MTTAYDELVDFLAAGTTRDRLVVAFRPSESTRLRVAEFLEKEKEVRLSVDERSELESYMQLEHLMRLAKAKARKHLQTRSSDVRSITSLAASTVVRPKHQISPTSARPGTSETGKHER